MPAARHSAASFASFRRTPRVIAGLTVSAFIGGLGLMTPASAAPPDGICNGVVNQAAHRGDVQPNLLRAAARKNAEFITKLQADRAVLQT